MNPLFLILRAAHCRSTHHFFAIDALPLVQTDAGQRLARVLLRHHDRYLRGAKDPDTRFRDFQNHVVHVTDGYWGGAPRVAHLWYDKLQNHLRAGRYSDAAHAAGVLSHYFTDPMMPLHTQQCEREKVLHRPIEWSVTRSYESILTVWRDDPARTVFNLSNNIGWLGEAILHGAKFANRSYFPLLDTYDLERGRAHPPDGLGLVAQRALSELFGLAITGWARVLERAARDAESAMGQPIAKASLSASTALAVIRTPARAWLKRIENRIEQDAVGRLISEFRRTGTLQKNLPADVDIVHRVIDVYRTEMASRESRRARRLAAKKIQAAAIQAANETNEIVVATTSEADLEPSHQDYPATIPFVPRSVDTPVTHQPVNDRCRLSRQDPLVNAPSIGPKTAQRFASVGIHTVGEFLDESAAKMAAEMLTYWITTETVTQWQWQAKLMCEIPELLARECQMLAGAQYNSASAVAVCKAGELHQEVAQFAMTSSGRRYLRGADAPKLSDVRRWIADSAEAISSARSAA
ncbi:DUF4332 domain-containing protein [Rubripirellula reticaptiva]|uniref:DUF4332 domain-containing protein n=1 Tax=Rubripirellula reticaptiva TaxID=2528013 RepID=A0A5C6FCG1_9BACT|nr:DUF4332 domain-containing protein [Rubripirellula reticaptiva]TWU58317.1 hypothetical protein Poly59_12280 [Rubripirellula reticaptiva]